MTALLKQRGTFDLIKQTRRGHKLPDAVTEATVFIYTSGCIYALDDDGFCMEVIPLQQTLPDGVTRCRGAQYVACLDKSSDAGMVPQPSVGGRALFVGRGTGQKMALLRTGPITSVEYRSSRSTSSATPAPHSSWGAADVELPWDEAAAQKTYQQLPAVRLLDNN